ncbi:hypothetical protein NUACC21_74600 [Scytonema sp. NUACC21]
MQDLLNIATIAIPTAFFALMIADFILGLIALATPKPPAPPVPPAPPRKYTLGEIMARPELTPTSEQQRVLDELEEFFAPLHTSTAVATVPATEDEQEPIIDTSYELSEQDLDEFFDAPWDAGLNYAPLSDPWELETTFAPIDSIAPLPLPTLLLLPPAKPAFQPKSQGKSKKVQTAVQTVAPKKRGRQRKTA